MIPSDFLLDLRLGLRGLLHQPGFSLVAILTLALAIGLNTVIFSFIDRIQIRPVIRERPEEVVGLYNASRGPERGFRHFTYAEYRALHAPGALLSELTAFSHRLCGVGREGVLRRSFVYYTSGNYFSLLGVKPFQGRFFTPEEAQLGSRAPVVVASYPLWQRLGGAPDFLGSTIRINEQVCTVVGIAPKGFGGTTAVLAPEAWLPLGMAEAAESQGQVAPLPLSEQEPSLMLLGRLRAGLDLKAAQRHAALLEGGLKVLPGESGRELVLARPSRTGLSSGPMDDSMGAVLGLAALGMAAVVLLIASLNLANLLLARGLARRKEFAVRLSLGASRGRVIRQLLCEGILLAFLGGVLGLWLSILGSNLLLQRLVAQFQSTTFSVALDLSPDGRVLAALLGYCALTVLVFSLGPALRCTRLDLSSDLKQQLGEESGRREGFFSLRHCLIMGQVALSLMLLFCSGLFLRSVIRLGRMDPGFASQDRLIAEFDYGLSRLSMPLMKEKQRQLLERVQAIPGVQRAALASQAPYSFFVFNRDVRAAGAAEERWCSAIPTAVTQDYFETMGISLVQGRSFTAAEIALGGGVILDEGLAQRLYGDRDPIGQRVNLNGAAEASGLPVLGVVRSTRHLPMGEARPPRVYLPLGADPRAHVYLHLQLRQGTSSPSVLEAMQQAFRNLDPGCPLLQALPMRAYMDRNISLSSLRLATSLFGIMASLALLLSLVGVYGVKAYMVATRTREVGIRMALGAGPRQVLQLFLAQGVQQTCIALLAGTLLALAAGRVFQGLLGPGQNSDGLVLLGASLLLAVVTLLACLVPAWRATRLHPSAVLKHD